MGDEKKYDLTKFGDLEPRVSIFCEIFSATHIQDKPPNITIEKDGGFAFVRIIAEESEGIPTYPTGLEKGDTVRLVGVIPSTNWKGELQLKVDPHARIERAQNQRTETLDCSILEPGGISMVGLLIQHTNLELERMENLGPEKALYYSINLEE